MTDWKPINVKPDSDREVIVWLQDGADSRWATANYFSHGWQMGYISRQKERDKIIAWADVTEPTVDQLNVPYKENEIREN